MKINFNQVLEGWRNHLIPPKDLKQLIEDVSEERLSKCLNCSFNSTCGEIKQTSYCKACGCNLKAKTKCLSCDCGITVLNAQNAIAIPLKWTAVTTQEEHDKIKEQIKNET